MIKCQNYYLKKKKSMSQRGEQMNQLALRVFVCFQFKLSKNITTDVESVHRETLWRCTNWERSGLTEIEVLKTKKLSLKITLFNAGQVHRR